MGKGDRRSRKGKIWRGSFGKTRPKKKNKRSSGTRTGSASGSRKG